jgi:hypothetical protein
MAQCYVSSFGETGNVTILHLAMSWRGATQGGCVRAYQGTPKSSHSN